MKLKLLFTAALSLTCFFSNAQAPNWQWAKDASVERITKMCTDVNGNVIISGSFSNPMIIGSQTLLPVGASDLYVSKYDALGNFLWAKSVGGTSVEYSGGLCVDASGNIYLAGNFYSNTIVIGTSTLTNKDTISGTEDIFMIKYNSSGNLLSAMSIGGNSADHISGIKADINGNTCITGYFSDTLTLGSSTLTCIGFLNIFTAKLNPSGNFIWAKSAGGTGNDQAHAIDIDPAGEVIVAGCYDSPTISFGTTTLTNGGTAADVFLAKYSSTGNLLWVKNSGGANEDHAESVSVDQNGNSFITGYFYSPTMSFGTVTISNAVNISATKDFYVVKYNSNGVAQWAKRAGGTSDDEGFSVASDPSGNGYLTGYFASPSISFGTTTLSNTGAAKLFVVKYDALGNFVWAKSSNSSNDYSVGQAISTNSLGNTYLAGLNNDLMIMGTFTLLPSNFIAKLESISTGINEISTELNRHVFPNPFDNTLTIETLEPLKIRIQDLNGKIILETTSAIGQTKLNTAGFAEGIYILRVGEGNSAQECRIMKKN